jgi:hypothetical protein
LVEFLLQLGEVSLVLLVPFLKIFYVQILGHLKFMFLVGNLLIEFISQVFSQLSQLRFGLSLQSRLGKCELFLQLSFLLTSLRLLLLNSTFDCLLLLLDLCC